MVGNNYDRIARYYDRIHHLFYGHAEIHAQVELLEYVRAGDRLLIVGGGTGWILEKIAVKFPSGLEITYIEGSSRMMELSKRRSCGENQVEFVLSVIEDWKGGKEYDCIVTGLFFDNFKEPHAAAIVGQLTLICEEWRVLARIRLLLSPNEGKVVAGRLVVDHVCVGTGYLRGGGEAVTGYGSAVW